jgi:8-oxo-dGTP pyrophosphatase MutT (NUDIX family)
MRPERISIANLRASLARRPPRTIEVDAGRQAAVAILLAERDGDAHALLIQRAERPGDPWSGHMAFPGGHREPHEQDLFLTAVRETFEEVGIDLHRQAEAIGRLDDIHAQAAQPVDLLIRPFVCAATQDIVPRPNHREVRDTLWVPLSSLAKPETAGTHRYPEQGPAMTFPAFLYQGFTIWGLTYRMLTALLETVS